MKSLIFLFLFVFTSSAIAFNSEIDLNRLAAGGESHICFFSFNNEKEEEYLNDFTKKINESSTHKIIVSTHQTENSNPEESFLKLVKSGKRCDGLVFSGHHTGAFGGKRANGQLEIDFLEKLSCNEKYKKFFENIKAVWLQGCRTLGGKIVSSEVNSEDVRIVGNSAQGHTLRLGDIAGVDSLEVNHEALEMHYAAALDQDNPLGTRYLRVFNRASIFAWSASAPGEKSNSELSIPRHIAHISQVLDPDRKVYFDDTINKIDDTHAVIFANTMIGMLQRGSEEFQQFVDCMGFSEEKSIEGWINHGTYEKPKKEKDEKDEKEEKEEKIKSYDNRGLNGLVSMANSGNVDLQRARELGCLLRSQNREVVLEALKEVLQNKNLIGYNWNTVLYHLKNKPNVDVLKIIKESGSLFKDFILQKIYSDGTGALAKFEFLQISKQLYPDEVILTVEEKKHISSYAAIVLNIEDEGSWSLIDYKEAIIQRILDYDSSLVDNLLINNSELSPVGFNRLARMALKNNNQFLPEPAIDAVLKNPNSDSYTFSMATTEMLNYMKRHSQNPGNFLELLLTSKSANIDNYLILKIVAAIDEFKPSSSESLIQAVIDHKKTKNSSLKQACEAIVNSKLSKSSKEDLLERILSREELSEETKLKAKKSLQSVLEAPEGNR